jgi:SsrA-binding protein
VKDNYKIVARNKKAGFEYFIDTEYEAGIVLQGSEIKSIRGGNVNLQDSHIEFDKNGELFILNMYIAPYKLATLFNHEAMRKRKLLLNKKEINKIVNKIKLKGFTCIPLVLYINHKNFAKIKIATAKGKKLYDKRESIREKDLRREESRLLTN